MVNPKVELIVPSTLMVLDKRGIAELQQILQAPLISGHVFPKPPDPDKEKGQPLIFSVNDEPLMSRAWQVIPISMGVRLSHFNHLERILTLFISDAATHDIERFVSDVISTVYTVEKVYIIGDKFDENSWFSTISYITLDEFFKAVSETLSREFGRNKGDPSNVSGDPDTEFTRVKDIVYSADDY